MPVIYIDVLIALNLFIDFMLLSASAYILRIPCRRLRLVAGAAIGGLGCCMVLAPELPVPLSLAVSLGQAAVIVRTAFAWRGIKGYLTQLAVFFISAAMFAGIAFGIWFFLAPEGFTVIRGVVYYDVSPLTLTALTVVSYIAICIYDRITHKKNARGSEWLLTVQCSKIRFTLRALYDTGHHVTDVFSGAPVALAAAEALEPHIPSDLLDALKLARSSGGSAGVNDTSGASGGEDLGGIAVKSRIRMIPCRTVSGTALLPAFKPDYAEIARPGGKGTEVTGMYLAVSEMPFGNGYQAIVGTDLTSAAEYS